MFYMSSTHKNSNKVNFFIKSKDGWDRRSYDAIKYRCRAFSKTHQNKNAVIIYDVLFFQPKNSNHKTGNVPSMNARVLI